MNTDLGVSSSCFYPSLTEESLETVGKCGFKNAEVFFNSPSELEDEFIENMIAIKEKYSINIVSVHPFTSFTESNFLFSNYERRFLDTLPFYERFFEVTKKLGADIFVIHGAKIPGTVTDEVYCERFKKLIEAGKKYGVRVCHENVVHHRCESPAYLKMMRDNIGDDFKIVLDIKQARRAGYSPFDFTEELADSIVHIHISDFNSEKDCITPLKGDFDFKKLFSVMNEKGYKGKYIIELYEWSYGEKEEIIEAYNELCKIKTEL